MYVQWTPLANSETVMYLVDYFFMMKILASITNLYFVSIVTECVAVHRCKDNWFYLYASSFPSAS